MASKRRRLRLTLPGMSPESDQILASLVQETDRGMALIAAAYVDEVLASMLRAVFVDKPKVVDRLLEYPGPLSSFAARCDLGYCIGLIGNKAYSDLKTIRKIRNEFAHRYESASFDEPDIKSLCGQLKAVTDLPPRFLGLPRRRFMMSAVLLADGLMMRGLFLEHRDIGKEFEFTDRPGTSGDQKGSK